MFPARINGYYMRDDVIAAFKWFDEFHRLKLLCNYAIHPQGPSIEIVAAWIFHPATDEKPFSFIKDLFEYRALLPKKDMRGEVVKLGINSVYGKLAQRVGKKGHPPKFAGPWHAAAITAGTRRVLIEAALTNPGNVIAFATDGIYTKRLLDVYVPETKQLGHWELKTAKHGGAFIQSGIYTVHFDDGEIDEEKALKVKSRGFSPQNIKKIEGQSFKKALDAELYGNIPQCWEDGKEAYPFDYLQYMTIGACVVHRGNWRLIGTWKIGPRELQLDTMSKKRVTPNSKRLKKLRASKLVDLHVNQFVNSEELSAKSVPDWLSEGTRREREHDEDESNIIAGLSQ
jgi:hypothetical protein